MIDFRYHLVSLASVLIALAVGIVLGAGPLKEDIGNTLTSEVTRLREEKAALRTQLDEANANLQARDSFGAAVLPVVTANELAGRTVTVVTLPGADSGIVTSTTDTLKGAGADIVASVSVTPAWADPATAKAAERKDLAAEIAGPLGLPSGGSAAQPTLDGALGAVLLNHGGSENLLGAAPDKARQAAWARLAEAGLVGGDIDPNRSANAAVLVGGPVTTGDAAAATDRAAAYAGLAAALDGAGMGAVLASNVGVAPTPADGASVVAAARKRGADATGLSTVDDAGIPLGQASVVEALVEQYRGSSGHYGLAADATRPFPELRAP